MRVPDIRLPGRRRLALLAAIVALVLPTGVALALSNGYTVTGVEVYAGTYEGVFVGTASGTTGDVATWKADVLHTPLGEEPTPNSVITGGYAELLTSDLIIVHGDFAPGGTVSLKKRAGSCGNETFRVEGILVNVTRSDDPSAGGTGTFTGTLTHFRTSILGHCIAYSASLSGRITLAF